MKRLTMSMLGLTEHILYRLSLVFARKFVEFLLIIFFTVAVVDALDPRELIC